MTHKTFFKEKTPRSEKYKAFIRTFPCMICSTTLSIEAAHMSTGGTGIKCSDYQLTPLCTEHHAEQHRGFKTFYKKYPWIDKWEKIAFYQEKYLIKLREEK